MLRRFGFMFFGCMKIRHQRHVDKQAVLSSDLQGYLSHCFNKRLAFNIADGTPDFGNDDVCVRFFTDLIDKFLDLVGDMRNDLHRGTQIFPSSFLIQHIPVHLAGCKVGVTVQILVDEPFIVTQIQIGFRSVLRHENLAVLIRAHGSRIHIDIGVQLLSGHLQASRLQQPSQGCRGDPFSESRYHAAGNKNIFGHAVPSRFRYMQIKKASSSVNSKTPLPFVYVIQNGAEIVNFLFVLSLFHCPRYFILALYCLSDIIILKNLFLQLPPCAHNQ